ncbi:MAG: SDR family oxidoreductase [Candidatus Nanopelagicales bacterium]|nr:SDR family oxidoreductase [Candidatus Nanopelagicales bacterium]
MKAVLLLTGATGMVGREVLRRAAADQRYREVMCLVRGPDARKRLADLMRAAEIDATRVVAVEGDVTQPDLGVEQGTLDQVTDVIHCAATVSFDLPLDDARRINVTGTANVIDVCRSLPKLRRLDAVSTCYVAGKRTGLIMESDLEHTAGFHNTYEQTKYESEQLLREAMADLHIAVHRPSIVVGDSRTGATGAWKVLYWPLKVIARGWLPVIPYDPDCRLDIVPVDFVADAIMALSNDPGTIGGTFHLAAGPRRDTTTGAMFPRVFRLLDRRPPVRVPPVLFRNVIRPLLMLAPNDRLKRTLQAGLVYRPYLELRLQFDTTQADAHLQPDVPCPPVLDYIDTIVAAALESDFGRSA